MESLTANGAMIKCFDVLVPRSDWKLGSVERHRKTVKNGRYYCCYILVGLMKLNYQFPFFLPNFFFDGKHYIDIHYNIILMNIILLILLT